MHDQPNDLDRRVGQLEAAIERLASENTSLKLELATLVSALRESQSQQPRRRVPVPVAVPRTPVVIEPPIRPSMAPAGVVVLAAVGLLSWQLIVTPARDQSIAPANRPAAAIARAADPIARGILPTIESTPKPLPTVYKGTLSVKSDLPGAKVFVNRQSVGTAPVRVRNLRAGSHLVWVEREGFQRWTRVVTVPAERVTSVSVDLEPVADDRD